MTAFFNIAGIRLAIKGSENFALPESYRPFLDGQSKVDIVLEWQDEPDIAILALLEKRQPLLRLRRWSVYDSGSELVYVLPVSPIARLPQIVRLSKSLDAGRVYGASDELSLLPMGKLTFPVMEYILAHRRGVLVHGAAVEVNGSGWLFVGPSEWGKSHWARQMEKQGATVLGDDRIILREHNGCIRVFGTPWNSNPRWCLPGGVPAERIFFLRQAGTNTVQAAPPSAGAALLLQACLLPAYDKQAMQTIVEVASHAVAQARPLLLGYATETPSMERLAEW